MILLILPENRYDYMIETIAYGLKANDIYFETYIILNKNVKENGIANNFITRSECEEKLLLYKHIFVFCSPPHFPSSPNDLNNSPLKILDELDILMLKKTRNRRSLWNICNYFDGCEYNFCNNQLSFPFVVEKHINRVPRGKDFIFTYMLKKCKRYFKRECYPEDREKGCIPCPFAFIDDVKIAKDKNNTILASFPACLTGYRREAVNIVNLIGTLGMKVNTKNNMNKKEYIDTICQTYISIDSAGGGHNNARTLELIGYGSILARQEAPIIIPFDFYSIPNENQMIIEYKDGLELLTLLCIYLHKPKEELEKIQKRAQEHLIKYHTAKARVRYVIEML